LPSDHDPLADGGEDRLWGGYGEVMLAEVADGLCDAVGAGVDSRPQKDGLLTGFLHSLEQLDYPGLAGGESIESAFFANVVRITSRQSRISEA
jgi:hypothetical protein